MKKYTGKVLSAFLIALILVVLTSYFNEKMDGVVRTLAIANSNKVLAGSCDASGTGTTYYVTASSLNVRSGAGSDNSQVDSLGKCTAVKVYCQTSNGWGKIAISSDKYVSMEYLSTSASGCSSIPTTNHPQISFNTSNISTNPSTIYYGNNFTASLTLTNIQNLGTDETEKIGITIKNSAGTNVTSSFNVNKNYNFSSKTMAVTITNNNVTTSDTYSVEITGGTSKITKTFKVNKKEFNFNLTLTNDNTPAENEENTWKVDLTSLIPNTLNMNDFNIQIINSKGQDKTSNFNITKTGTTAYITNKKRVILNWKDTVSDYAPEGNYTIKVILANSSDYASDKVPGFTKTANIKIDKLKTVLEEDPNLRQNTRYRLSYSRSDYNIDVVGTKNVNGNTYYIVKENDVKTKVTTTKEYLEHDIQDTYPNLNLDNITTEARYGNKVSLKFNDINIVNYNKSTEKIIYYSGGKSTTVSKEDFEEEYPTAYNVLIGGQYTFASNGDLQYHDSGVGTKITKKIDIEGAYQPLAITGGEIKMAIYYENFLRSQMQNISANLKNASTNQTIIQNATETSPGVISDSYFSLAIDKETGKSDQQIYLTLKFNGSGDKYIGNYVISLNVGGKIADITFNLQDAPLDYYVYSTYDDHAMDSDALPAKVKPYSNRNYEYYIGVYMMKAKIDITEIEKKSIGYRIFDHRVDVDNNGNEYFFDETEYVVKIKRIANGQVYYSLSLDNGATYQNNLSSSIASFAANYEEAYEYIKDYSAGKKQLKYYNLDDNGYIISDNFPMHIIRTYKNDPDDQDMCVDYTTDASSTVVSALMNDDFKHNNSDMYYMISTRFSYDSSNNYILGAIRGRHQSRTDKSGNPIVGHEVTDQFYVKINEDSDPKNTVTILPKTEVAPGSYYIYLTHNGSQGVGYILDDDSPEAAIDKDIYPELWQRNIHMTEFTYNNPYYDVTFKEPSISNSATDAARAYTNVESYIDLNFTLDYIYDITNYSYRIEYNNNGKWVDASSYFEIVDDIQPTMASDNLTQDVLKPSSIHLTTKVGTTKQGTYRVVMNYSNNGFKMNQKVQTFEVGGNHYGLNINNDYENNRYFYHNFASSIEIPIEGYSINDVNAFRLKVAYHADETTKVYYTWNRANRTFTDSLGIVYFTYTYNVEQVDDNNLIYKVTLKNYEDKDGKPIDLSLGKYSFEVEYQETNGELAAASTAFEVKPDTHNIIIKNEYPYANETEMGIKLDIEAQYIPYDELDREITYTVFYYDINQRKPVDVSDVDAETRMFTITDTWDDKNRGLESESYHGNIFLHINQSRIDLDGRYYIAAYYQEKLMEEFEISNLRNLFSWSIEKNDIHGLIEIDGKEIEANGFYNNIANTYMDVTLNTVHTNNASYLITQDCAGFTCSPTLATSYNDRFDLIEQTASHIKLKYKDNLPSEMKLQPGKYQLVVYYGENDYKISDFEIKSEYVDISIIDSSIRTKIGPDRYVANKLFSNKDSTISVAARVFGIDYSKVNIKLTNPDQSTNFENYFIIDRDNFYDSHILEITYKASANIPSGNYLLMIYYIDADGNTVEDHVDFTFSSVYYNFELTGVSYDPNPAVPNYENGGNVMVDVETDDLLNKTPAENTIIREQMINNVSVTNESGEDVTNLFTKSVIETNSESNFKLNLQYAKNTIQPGNYKVTMSYTLQGYTITKTINFQMGDYERSITITGVEIKSNTQDGKIHNNYGGTYIVNYESNYPIYTNDLNVQITNASNEDVTSKFNITKNDGNVEIKYTPSADEIAKGTYKVSLIYTDPQTMNVDTKTTDIRMYGNYKEVTIKDIRPSVTPIIAENSNQYYTFNLVTTNLTSEEIANIKMRVYDSHDNIVYSNISTDNAPNWFNTTKISDEEYQVNILPYQARVGEYYVVVCLSDGEDEYFESNRLKLTIDDTQYKVDLWGSDIIPLEKINNTDDIYDYIGVDGTFKFTTTHPETDDTAYSIKMFKNNVLVEEIPITADYVENYRKSQFQKSELKAFGEIEFALCINGLPYASKNVSVLEYIKVTNVSVVLDYQDVADSININQGDSKTFTLVVEPANATNKNLIFTSSDLDVATFNGNTVTIVGPGSTTVTLKNKEFSKQFTITANSLISSNIYAIDYTKKTIFVNKMNSKSISKTAFINNLQNVSSSYKVYDGKNNLITSALAPIGTTYKLVSGSETYTIIVIGDLNADGIIDLGDITTLRRIYRGYITPTEMEMIAGRVTHGQNIDTSDVITLFRFYRGRINEI